MSSVEETLDKINRENAIATEEFVFMRAVAQQVVQKINLRVAAQGYVGDDAAAARAAAYAALLAVIEEVLDTAPPNALFAIREAVLRHRAAALAVRDERALIREAKISKA